MEQLSQQIFQEQQDERRIPAAKLTALLTSIGRTQTLLAKIRYSAVSTNRLLSFLAGMQPDPRREPHGRSATTSPA